MVRGKMETSVLELLELVLTISLVSWVSSGDTVENIVLPLNLVFSLVVQGDTESCGHSLGCHRSDDLEFEQ
jgi:hypothetical protein